ncbi:transposase, partial [Caballeronia arationis]|uniref:transposase n=1 Tax=Caballeronia arationis TaxID=1777142 RepID=UPI001F32B403
MQASAVRCRYRSPHCLSRALPYLQLVAKHCPRALNVLDRFHIVAKMNLALDDVRAAEARRM